MEQGNLSDTQAAAAAALSTLPAVGPRGHTLTSPRGSVGTPEGEDSRPDSLTGILRNLPDSGVENEIAADADQESLDRDPITRLFETHRGRMILIDQLLGALGAWFALFELSEPSRQTRPLALEDPSLIVGHLREMLGVEINRLDRVHVDPLLAALTGRRGRGVPNRGPKGGARGGSSAKGSSQVRVKGRAAREREVREAAKVGRTGAEELGRRKRVRR